MGVVGKITLDADTFRALASSTRLTVLKSLDERRKTLTELSRDLALNKATVHEHMALLTAAGLVKKRDDEGRKWIYYELTWTGQRILHPEATTTFNLLLALSVAAAGGGVAMLGRAMGWWLEDTIATRQSDGADLAPEGGFDRLVVSEGDADQSAQGEPASAPATSDPSGAQASSSQTAAPAAGAPASDNGTPDEESMSLDGSGSDGSAGGDTAGSTFFDDGGWIGLALLLTCALFLGLALILQRKFVSRPLDPTSAEAAELGHAPRPPSSPPGAP